VPPPAVHLALHMTAGAGREIRPGELAQGEVLTTALTCTATNWPILANGLRITWVDVDPATLNVDLDDLARKVSPATRAIVVVHWAGYPLDLDRLSGILDAAEARYGFRPSVIEDCAHACGSTCRCQPLGNLGNIAVYSFQAIKHLITGDGGVIVFPTGELAEREDLALLRHGPAPARRPPAGDRNPRVRDGMCAAIEPAAPKCAALASSGGHRLDSLCGVVPRLFHE